MKRKAEDDKEEENIVCERPVPAGAIADPQEKRPPPEPDPNRRITGVPHRDDINEPRYT